MRFKFPITAFTRLKAYNPSERSSCGSVPKRLNTQALRYMSRSWSASLLARPGSACLGQTGKVSEERIKVSIALDHREFHLGDPIELKLEISNFGRAPILIANSVS